MNLRDLRLPRCVIEIFALLECVRGVGWQFVTGVRDNVGLIFKGRAVQEELRL
jgi:hypothetical protein